ncbi:hypothetical protein C475_19518 [Halosimplex carlsbadense 2-9-1]|uniref:DUF1508 domain-containing protein n=1 Tax=Halosimplex carlsbadense 2-9-1 TaxID=797114 RepID=M0CC08_9EURY|nr:hypothetical protein C475_19518 [Halosimplex carlsbadense 2-9-1]
MTADLPPEAELEVELDREGDVASLDIEMEWDDADGDIETDTPVSKARFERYEDADDQWRWRLVHDNGNIIADSGEGYTAKQSVTQGLESVKTNAADAVVVDQSNDDGHEPDEPGSDATFELYEDNEGKWRWRLAHDNGEIIADGGQGYSSKQKAKQGLESVRLNVSGAPIEDPQ